MPGSTDMDAVWDTASAILDCVHATLAETDAGAPARRCVVPGSEVAWDECECGGQLTVHVLRTYPSDSFPLLKISGPFTGPCQAVYTVAEYVVTVLRCTPTLHDNGDPPTCAELSAAAHTDQQDRWAVRRGVSCCFANDDPRVLRPMLLQEQLAVGALGACAGSEQHVFVGHPNCLDCGASPVPPPAITGIDGGDTAPAPADIIDGGATAPPPTDIFDGGST